MADIDATFVQKVFDVAKRKRKPNVHHHRQPDDFGRRLEILEWVAFCHSVKLDRRPARLNQVSSDSTLVRTTCNVHAIGTSGACSNQEVC